MWTGCCGQTEATGGWRAKAQMLDSCPAVLGDSLGLVTQPLCAWMWYSGGSFCCPGLGPSQEQWNQMGKRRG